MEHFQGVKGLRVLHVEQIWLIGLSRMLHVEQFGSYGRCRMLHVEHSSLQEALGCSTWSSRVRTKFRSSSSGPRSLSEFKECSTWNNLVRIGCHECSTWSIRVRERRRECSTWSTLANQMLHVFISRFELTSTWCIGGGRWKTVWITWGSYSARTGRERVGCSTWSNCVVWCGIFYERERF